MIGYNAVIRISRVLIFYSVVFLSTIPAIILITGTLRILSAESNATFSGVLIFGSGCTLELAALALTGLLVPIYIFKINKANDWTNRFLTNLGFAVFCIPLLLVVM